MELLAKVLTLLFVLKHFERCCLCQESQSVISDALTEKSSDVLQNTAASLLKRSWSPELCLFDEKYHPFFLMFSCISVQLLKLGVCRKRAMLVARLMVVIHPCCRKLHLVSRCLYSKRSCSSFTPALDT